MRLTNAEEQVMKYLWKLEKAYMKNILEQFPKPKHASTTISTLLKRMAEKKFIGYNQHGNNREYFPLVKKTDYFSGHVKNIIKEFFNNSSTQFASFFTTETNMSEDELKELKKIIDNQLTDNQ